MCCNHASFAVNNRNLIGKCAKKKTFQGGASFVDPFCYLCFMLSLLCCIVYSLQPCDHLLEKDWPLGSLVCCVSLVFVTFPYGVPGQVRYLIELTPDLFLPFYSVVLKAAYSVTMNIFRKKKFFLNHL